MANTRPTSILLCEADVNYGMLFCEFLQNRGYKVDLAHDGTTAWQLFTQNQYDICIFEVRLPQKNGLELTRDIRATESTIPIIFLTERKQPEDILAGYHAGADDYVIKPCLMEIMICKIESIMRRIREKEADAVTIYPLGQFTFDVAHQTLTSGDQTIHLSSRENDVLLMLCKRANRLVERSTILKNIWQNDSYFSTRSLSVYINHLRHHLAAEPKVKIMSVHGKGYKIVF